jgi:UDP-N-acetylglucosamine acyltransferase
MTMSHPAALGGVLGDTDPVEHLRRLPPVNEPHPDYTRRGGAWIHPTAIASPGAELGSDVVIGPFAVVEGQTRIGAGTQLGAHCVIKRFTVLGSRNRVYEHVVLGGEPQDVGFKGEDSRLLIGDENVIREGVSIHRAKGHSEATVVGSHNYLMANVHIGHNCAIGDRVGIASNTGLSGYVRVENDAYISGHVGIVGRCRIGRAAVVGGMSKVIQDVLPFCSVNGVPAVLLGLDRKGFRRAKVPAAQIRNLTHAYRLLAARGLVLEESLEAMSRLGDPLVDELVAFVRSSTRGFCRPRRASSRRMTGTGGAGGDPEGVRDGHDRSHCSPRTVSAGDDG